MGREGGRETEHSSGAACSAHVSELGLPAEKKRLKEDQREDRWPEGSGLVTCCVLL